MRHRQGPSVGKKDRFDLGEPRVLSESAAIIAPGPCLKAALLQIRRSIRLLCEPIGSRNQSLPPIASIFPRRRLTHSLCLISRSPSGPSSKLSPAQCREPENG